MRRGRRRRLWRHGELASRWNRSASRRRITCSSNSITTAGHDSSSRTRCGCRAPDGCCFTPSALTGAAIAHTVSTRSPAFGLLRPRSNRGFQSSFPRKVRCTRRPSVGRQAGDARPAVQRAPVVLDSRNTSTSASSADGSWPTPARIHVSENTTTRGVILAVADRVGSSVAVTERTLAVPDVCVVPADSIHSIVPHFPSHVVHERRWGRGVRG
jgi:hypothetical protein